MDLHGMTMKELVVDAESWASGPSWTCKQSREVWAELKRKCEEIEAARKGCPRLANCPANQPVLNECLAMFEKDDQPACPCPMAAKQPACAKCGKVGLTVRALRRSGLMCDACYDARPDAPGGYELVGEWRRPIDGEYFLTTSGTVMRKGDPDAFVSPLIDQGCRWILREKESG